MFNKIIILIFLFLIFSSFPAKIIQAADGEATVPSQAFSGAGQAPATTNFFSYVQFLYPFGLSVAAILAVFMLVFAGLQMMASAGNPGMIESAKGRISAAILGLLIAVGSYVILRTINPDLVRLKLTVPQVNITGGQGSAGGGRGGETRVPCPPGSATYCTRGAECKFESALNQYVCIPQKTAREEQRKAELQCTSGSWNPFSSGECGQLGGTPVGRANCLAAGLRCGEGNLGSVCCELK